MSRWAAGNSGVGTVPDASTTTKGVLLLGGDLGGTAAVPTVPGLAGKANTAHTHGIADLPAGSVVYINQNGDGSWPNRPTARTDIKVVGTMVVSGSAPPATATAPAVNGLYVADIVVRT